MSGSLGHEGDFDQGSLTLNLSTTISDQGGTDLVYTPSGDINIELPFYAEIEGLTVGGSDGPITTFTLSDADI